MGKPWQLQEAKNKFSELVNKALKEGPQTVTRHGHLEVVVLSAREYLKMTQAKKRGTLVEFFRNSPLTDLEIDLSRRPDMGRIVKL